MFNSTLPACQSLIHNNLYPPGHSWYIHQLPYFRMVQHFNMFFCTVVAFNAITRAYIKKKIEYFRTKRNFFVGKVLVEKSTISNEHVIIIYFFCILTLVNVPHCLKKKERNLFML